MWLMKSTYEQMTVLGDKVKGRKLKLIVKDNRLNKEKIDHIYAFIQRSGVKEF